MADGDDPAPTAHVGNIKVTRADWLHVALDALVSDGVEQVKVQPLGERLGVSRSSFYWYFKSRQHLLDALLQHWRDTNTAALVKQAEAPAATITGAVCNVFHCVFDEALFNTSLDFAIRDWGRRSGKVRRVLDQSDKARLDALAAMFRRFAYPEDEAQVRARILYFMQIGYNDADLQEPLEDRIRATPHYLAAFTGQEPHPDEVTRLAAFARSIRDG